MYRLFGKKKEEEPPPTLDEASGRLDGRIVQLDERV